MIDGKSSIQYFTEGLFVILFGFWGKNSLPSRRASFEQTGRIGYNPRGKAYRVLLRLSSRENSLNEKEDKVQKADVVVIGGSAAGPVAGISCRRRYPEKKVVLIRREEQVLVPCGIPYIFGTVGSPEKNLIPDALLLINR